MKRFQKWWAKRRLHKHADYVRDLRVKVLAKEYSKDGILVTDTYQVLCGWCKCQECGCDVTRNAKLKMVRGDLRAIHQGWHTTIKQNEELIDDLEDRLHVR